MVRAGLGSAWQCLTANDLCPKKAATYAANWGGTHLVVRDVHAVTTAELPGHADLAWGSFPCQDLSIAGMGAGLDGARSGAFWGFWNLMRGLVREQRKPKIIVLENVIGALTSHGGKDFASIANALAGEGYRFGAMVIDAVHFLPQSRPRLFFVAADTQLHIPDALQHWTSTQAWHPDALIRAHNRLPGNQQAQWVWWSPPLPAAPLLRIEHFIDAGIPDSTWHSAETTANLIASMTPTNRSKLIAAQAGGVTRVGTIYRRTRNGIVRAEVRFDGISGCLRTPTGGSSRQTLIVVEGPRIRSRLLSAREAARLMGLPDGYQLPQRYNDAYHLVGDGVAVPVVRHLAQHILAPVLAANISASKIAA